MVSNHDLVFGAGIQFMAPFSCTPGLDLVVVAQQMMVIVCLVVAC
jgi:hypothetical protein